MNRILSKILVIGAGIAAAASVASCDLTTESPSNFNEMNLFSDPTLTEYQLYSVYNIFGGTNAHRGRYLPWYGYNTDIEWFISSDRGDKSQIAMYDIRVTNTQLNQDNGPYNELYSGIERVNLTINGIRKYGDPQERPEMAALLGEALTLRAVLYAELLKAFGEVPARFEPVTPETIYLNKSDRDVIYPTGMSSTSSCSATSKKPSIIWHGRGRVRLHPLPPVRALPWRKAFTPVSPSWPPDWHKDRLKAW